MDNRRHIGMTDHGRTLKPKKDQCILYRDEYNLSNKTINEDIHSSFISTNSKKAYSILKGIENSILREQVGGKYLVTEINTLKQGKSAGFINIPSELIVNDGKLMVNICE